jgi:geranylgeranyl pyrophosphate synthase
LTTTGPRYALVVRPELARVETLIQKVADQAVSQGITPMLAHALQTPGKRLRPALTLLSSRFGRGADETVVLMAAAVELLHLATLLHDDMVDAAATRRGHATVNAVWGPNAAVLVGDYLFAASATYVCDTKNVRVIRRFAQTIMELSSGQLMEQVQAYKTSVTRAQYLERIYNKTGSLFATSLESGAVLAGASEERVGALTTYGKNLGLAFQVVDDVLDFQGDSGQMGKPVGEDLANGVLTLPAIMLLEQAPGDNPVRAYFADQERREHLAEALRSIREHSVMQKALAYAVHLRDEAMRALDVLPTCEARDILREIAEFVIVRNK